MAVRRVGIVTTVPTCAWRTSVTCRSRRIWIRTCDAAGSSGPVLLRQSCVLLPVPLLPSPGLFRGVEHGIFGAQDVPADHVRQCQQGCASNVRLVVQKADERRRVNGIAQSPHRRGRPAADCRVGVVCQPLQRRGAVRSAEPSQGHGRFHVKGLVGQGEQPLQRLGILEVAYLPQRPDCRPHDGSVGVLHRRQQHGGRRVP